ncbi:MAG: HlyD family secretion protein [Gemmatales bacterium]|nr:HlyD family secretion protein [Gemmatales bacterium]MDW8386341.1 biotin/lipoyl-binding protein [Gemmatales bacterium]
MIRKLILPLIAAGMLGFAIWHVMAAHQTVKKVEPPIEPARNPFGKTVAGAGLIEAQTENINVGSPLPGIVTKVFVKPGQRVSAGEPLFALDDRELQAELRIRKAELDSAKAELDRLEKLPRPEEVRIKEARVRELRAALAEQKTQLELTENSFRGRAGAVSVEEMVRRRQAYEMAKEQLAWAEADLHLLQSGAWEPDKAIARAAVEMASAKLKQTETNLERLTVRALVDGEVLQVNVRPGEFVGAPSTQALIVLGNIQQLHVRVDIDEHDVPRFIPGAAAWAVLRGDTGKQYPLRFVRVEPFVIPKKSLTGDNRERVDTRVLQAIFAFDPTPSNVYVGMQVDVFIDAELPSDPASPGTQHGEGNANGKPASTTAEGNHNHARLR